MIAQDILQLLKRCDAPYLGVFNRRLVGLLGCQRTDMVCLRIREPQSWRIRFSCRSREWGDRVVRDASPLVVSGFGWYVRSAVEIDDDRRLTGFTDGCEAPVMLAGGQEVSLG